jgi:hypothetical protein
MSFVNPQPCPCGSEHLTCIDDSITVCQGTTPWVVEGTLEVESATADNAIVTSIPASTTTTTIFASNLLALGRIITNDSTATMFIKFGAAASTTDYSFKLVANDKLIFTVPVYVGLVTAVWASATGFARATEMSD